MFSILPLWYQYGFVFVFGLIIGSFLNVYIYRFHTGKSLAGSSHCLSCGRSLRPYELVPVLSYVFLRGRCRTCGSYVPVRYLLVELLTGALFLMSYLTATSYTELAFFFVVTTLMVVISVYDMRHFIIPDSLTIALTVSTVVWYGYQVYEGVPVMALLPAFGAALAGAGFFFLLWFVSKGAWLGFGDVKLAIPLGLIVGPSLVFSMIVYSFWIGAFVSVLLVGFAKIMRGQLRLRNRLVNLTMKSVIPFAPFMIAGCLLALFTNHNVLSLFTSF